MNFRNFFFAILPWGLLLITLLLLWRNCSRQNVISVKGDEATHIINHHMVVNKIEAMGKLELVKYYMKDIVEHKVEVSWWPDSEIILIINGEVVGCLDLTKIDSNDVALHENKVRVKLPDPEICYYKIDHQKSKVYQINNRSLSKSNSEMVDTAYKYAEEQIKKAAYEMKVLEQTRKNASLVLKPILEEMTKKPVEIYFENPVQPIVETQPEDTASVDSLSEGGGQ